MPRLPWRELVLWTLLGLAAGGALLAYNYSISADELGGFVVTSPTDVSAPIIGPELGPSALHASGEHDGHVYYLMARSPMHFDDVAPYVDLPGYRLGRPLYAWVAWAFHPTGGGPGLVLSMFLVGAASLALGGVALGSLSVTLGGKPWPAAVFPVALGSVLSMRISVPDPLALALAVVAIVLLLRHRLAWALVFGALAVLTRESVLVLFLGLLVTRRDRESLLLCAVPGGVIVAWTAFVRLMVPNAGGPAAAFTFPFRGWYQAVRFWADGYEPLGLVAFLIALVLAGIALRTRGLRHPLSAMVLIQLAFMSTFTVDVLGPERNASRAVLPLTCLAVVMLASPALSPATATGTATGTAGSRRTRGTG